MLNIGSPASSNSRRRSQVHGGTAWLYSSARLCAWLALPWIQRASSESVALTRGGSFAETTRICCRVEFLSLGETQIRAFWNLPTSGNVGVRALREALCS
jgi:hypothetical protein